MQLRIAAQLTARPDLLGKGFGQGQPGGISYFFGRLVADRLAAAQPPHGFLTHPCGLPDPCPLAFRQQLQQRSRCRIGGILPHSVLGQIRIERHEVRRTYLVDLHVTQSRRHSRHQLSVLCGRLGLQLAVCVLGEPAFYQIIQLHGRIQRNAAVHFLFKGIRLTLQFLFQLLPGQAKRGSEGAVYQHLTALPIIAVGDPDAVGASAVLLHPLYDLRHLSPLLCGHGIYTKFLIILLFDAGI